MKRRPRQRLIDGAWHEVRMWLVVERRDDGTPLVMRLCDEQATLGDELEAAGIADNPGKPEFHLLWTPTRWRRD